MEKHPHYWQIKAAVLTHQLALIEARAALQAALRPLGVDPTKNYTLDDKAETVTELVPPAAE